jgi:tripartite-type tricarboxylate transporter receptor subunit TctC
MSHTKGRARLAAIALALLPVVAAAWPAPARGQDAYPSRPITLVAPFPPGGVADPAFKTAMDKLETPITFKPGAEFQAFFDADARRLAEGVRKVGRVEEKK